MIVSHKHEFIFVRVPKTASTSTELFLAGHCGPEDMIAKIYAIKDHESQNCEHTGLFNHSPAVDIKKHVTEDQWNRYYKFCTERNPWDKVISKYYFLLEHNCGFWKPTPGATLNDYITSKEFSRASSFWMYTDGTRDKKVLVDKILRYENLAEEMAEVCDRIGIPFNGDLGWHKYSDCRKDRRHYREVLTDEQRDIIAAVFRKEIALLGYTF